MMTLLDVVQKVSPLIQNNSNIHAMWLEGSWATGQNNVQSDIDVWLDVADGTFDQSISSFRDALLRIGEIDWEKSRGVYSTSPKLQKHTFHLAGFPVEQVVELDLQEHSRKFKFKQQEHFLKVIFDKDMTIQWMD